MEKSAEPVSSICAMGHPPAESRAQFHMGDPTLHRSSSATTAPHAREDPPPPPGLSSPSPAPITGAPLVEPPVWSVSAAPVAATPAHREPAMQAPVDAQPVPRRWSVVATTFAVALLAFYLLQFATASVFWLDAEIRTPGQADAMVTWAVCAALVLPALLLRGRWRALPLAAATLAGTLAPVLLSRDLLRLLGIPDVWVGQAFTLHVIFPLCLGIPATIAALLSPVRGATSTSSRSNR